MKLSILIPTIPERIEQFAKLHDRIVNELMWRTDYEILTDNAERGVITVGEKRQRLLNRASGKYLTFIDDDDNFEDGFLAALMTAIEYTDADVICTKQYGVIDGRKYYFDISIDNPIEQLHDNGEVKRQPSVNCVWLSSKAKKATFPDLSIGEDAEWVKQISPQTELKLDITGMHYYYDGSKSAANQHKRIAFVSFSKGERYAELSRLQKEAFDKHNDIKAGYFLFTDEEQVGSPLHTDIPYAFKPYCINHVRNLGYNFIVWLDAPVHPVRPLSEVVNLLDKEKIILVDNAGWTIGDFTSDKCLSNLDMNREDSFLFPMVMACVMGFDFRDAKTNLTFNQYYGWVHENTYGGDWNNNNNQVSADNRVRGHRHDQSVISILAVKNGITLLYPNGIIAYKNEPTHKDWIDNALFISGK